MEIVKDLFSYNKTNGFLSKLRLCMIPSIVISNIRISNEITKTLEPDKNNIIVGYKSACREINYSSNKDKNKARQEAKRKSSLNSNYKNRKKKPENQKLLGKIKIKKKKLVSTSFQVITKYNDINFNISIFSTGTYRVASKSINPKEHMEAVRQVCEHIMSKYKMEENKTWWFSDPLLVIDKYISSCETRYLISEVEKPSDIIKKIKKDIKENNPHLKRDFDGKKLKTILTKNKNCIVINSFPTVINSTCRTSEKICCAKIYRLLNILKEEKYFDSEYSNFEIRYDPNMTTDLTILLPIPEDSTYSITATINSTGSITITRVKNYSHLSYMYKFLCRFFENPKERYLKNPLSYFNTVVKNFINEKRELELMNIH